MHRKIDEARMHCRLPVGEIQPPTKQPSSRPFASNVFSEKRFEARIGKVSDSMSLHKKTMKNPNHIPMPSQRFPILLVAVPLLAGATAALADPIAVNGSNFDVI